MAENLNNCAKTETNEEIIDELTRNLQSQCLDSETKEVENVDKETEEFDEPKTETDRAADFVDEDALEAVERTLTLDQLVERRTSATALKVRGNEEFKSASYLESIGTYTDALQLCPLNQVEERSILYANRAAAKVQLDQKEPAIDDCSKAIQLNSKYVRAYLRRAKLLEEIDKLDESLEDFKKVIELDNGNVEATKATVRLPPLIHERNEKLKTEMLDKLKDLGNVVLKPFGLSTENFKMQQDPQTGSYSINFQQNRNT